MEIKQLDDRIPLVLWSGGLDSTYTLLRELEQGDVDVLEISFKNVYPEHLTAERLTRDALYKKIQVEEGRRLKGCIRSRLQVDFEYPVSHRHHGFMHYGQQPGLIFCAYMNHDPRRHSRVVSSVVMSDTIAMHADAMTRLWDAYREVSPTYTQKRCYGRFPIAALEYPLLYGCIDKKSVWEGFNMEVETFDVWAMIRENTWSCNAPSECDENGNLSLVPCGVCDSCQVSIATGTIQKSISITPDL